MHFDMVAHYRDSAHVVVQRMLLYDVHTHSTCHSPLLSFLSQLADQACNGIEEKREGNFHLHLIHTLYISPHIDILGKETQRYMYLFNWSSITGA